MVRAPDIEYTIEAAFELVDVISDVGGEVGVDAVVALDHAVLLVAEVGGAEPQGAVLFVNVAVLLHGGDGAVDHAGFVQGLFREPGVEKIGRAHV
jgi:hypothetical protein